MKTLNKKVIIFAIAVIAILLVLFLASFFKKDKITDLDGYSFEELCDINNDMWMKMKPWRDGKKISDEKCLGCMIGENHFCNAEGYTEYIKSLSKEKDMEHSMEHNAMVAHAGSKNSVDIYQYNVGFSKDKMGEGLYNLTFIIKDMTSNERISNLDIVHDKIMHIVLIRDDLKYFDHVHPELVDKKFIVPYSFSAPGNYRIWVDFRVNEMQYIVDFDTNIVDAKETAEIDKIHGLNIEMNLQKEEIGEISKIDFSVTDQNKPISITEKFLAANAHMIVIDRTLEEFGHAHDEKFDRDNILSFDYKFKNEGIHKIWVQFSVDSNVITKEFEVEV